MTPDPPDLKATVAELLQDLRQPVTLAAPHERVLREAMALMSERGYAGASLRELARRLEMSQPSLYHYFESKEQLVYQVVRFYAARALRVPADAPVAPTLVEGLRYGLTRMAHNYDDPEHRDFMRFLVAVGRERPDVQVLARELLLDRARDLLTRFVDVYVASGELLPQDGPYLVEMVTHSLMLRLLRDHVLFPSGAQPEDATAFADFVVDAAVRGVRARAATGGAM